MKKNNLYLAVLSLLVSLSCDKNDPDPIFADFIVESKELTEGDQVTFTDKSSGNVESWRWTFEGGFPETSTEQNPTVIYYKRGTYDVTLMVRNSESSDNKVIRDLISVAWRLDSVDIPEPDTLKNVVYGINPNKHTANIYLPEDRSAPSPLVIVAGGGVFEYLSDLKRLDPLCQMLADRGIAAAAIRYRNVPGASEDPSKTAIAQTYVDQDISAAVRFFRKESLRYKIDTTKIFTGGYSSGAIGALIQAYFEYEDIHPSLLPLYRDGKDGAQGNPGYSSSSIGVLSFSGEMYVGLGYIEQDDPHFFGVCALDYVGVTCDSAWTEDGSTPKYGPMAITPYAKSVGLIADNYSFPGSNHRVTVEEPEAYIDQLMEFINKVIEEESGK